MKCPLCGTDNAYVGLFKTSCVNASCTNYDAPISAPSNFPAPFFTGGGFPSGKVTTIIAPPTIAIASARAPSALVKQRTLGQDILREASFIAPAIIAGGAPRDWDRGEVAKDIDLFVKSDDPMFFVQELERNLKKTHSIVSSFNVLIPSNNKYSFNELKCVYEGNVDGYCCQVIFPNDHWDLENFVAETFDFGINKILIKIDSGIMTTKQLAGYFNDKKNCTLTIDLKKMVQYNRWRSLPKRSAKFTQMFPHYKLVIV